MARGLPVRQPDWIATAPLRVEASRTIDASPARVWEVVADHERWPTWFPTMLGVEVTGASEGVGGRRRVAAPGIRFDEEFTAWEPEHHFGFSIVAVSPVPLVASMAESITITALGSDRCTVTYLQGAEPTRLTRPVAGVMRRLSSRMVEGALDQMAEVAAGR